MKAIWLDTGKELSPDEFAGQGLRHERVPPSEPEARIQELKRSYGYDRHEVLELSSATPDLDAWVSKFGREHLFTEDHGCFVLAGEGFLEVRSWDDRWVRVLLEAGDFVQAPANRYRQFHLTDLKRVRMARLSKGAAGSAPFYREIELEVCLN